MSRTKKAKAVANTVPVPQDAMEADAFVQRIGDAQRRALVLKAALDETIAAAKKRAEAEAATIAQQIQDATRGLQIWADANRTRLTREGATKTVRMPSGEIAWRMRPASISIKEAEKVLEALLADKKLGRFVRTKHEIDKEALLKEPVAAAAIDGITVKSGIEDFVVTPAGMQMAAETDAKVAA
ncbi:host-nuclease inhibitor Gam family protein [Falsiroseomonas sp.]|uniref:host-nuclease inhibitor Gam family protein n=1 Tax=Falsiroseomonas sp. TaxID=2870721 RepID=UPI003F72B59F